MYKKEYKKSIESPEEFWQIEAKNIEWFKFPEKIFNKDNRHWFEDGELNLSYLCIDKHIEDGFGDEVAIIYDSPVTNTIEKISYHELLVQVSKLAGGLKSLGVQKGDTVIIYMPMIPQAIYSMLACVRIGAIHSVVFGGFAPHELAIRIDDSEPKAVICASNGIEIEKVIPYKPMVDKAIKLATHKPEKVVVFDREQDIEIPEMEYDVDFSELIKSGKSEKAVSLKSTDPSYVLYTSGTTGKPKGIVRDTGGYATALKYSMKSIYGVDPGDTFWAASDVGWVVGHSYIVYAPLLNRNTTVLFEGKPVKTPDASTFWRVIKEHNVKVLFTAPTAIRAIRKEDPKGDFIREISIPTLKYLFLAGERCDAATLNWAEDKLNVPVIDHWWQTESGWPMVANMAGVDIQPVKPGSATFPVCGYNVQILSESGEELGANSEGYVAVKLPLPPGNLLGLWKNEERFVSGYLSKFPGYYFTGDGGYKDYDNYIYITGRVDDVINVAGHRLSTAEMEEIVSMHPSVAECAVFGIHCDLKGQKPLGLVVLNPEKEKDHLELQNELVQMVRKEIGPVASFKQVVVVKRLPKTRSGKILRKLLRDIADNREYNIPSTIDDISIVSEIEEAYANNKIIEQ